MMPLQIKVVDKKYLYIKWNDDKESSIKLVNLRRDCPCAVCEVEREQRGSKYIPIYSDEQLKIKNIQMVGNYAVGIDWTDKHNTGIYDFMLLKKMAIQ
jgi:DUF971 family protein